MVSVSHLIVARKACLKRLGGISATIRRPSSDCQASAWRCAHHKGA
jgi:hypothetical protein